MKYVAPQKYIWQLIYALLETMVLDYRNVFPSQDSNR